MQTAVKRFLGEVAVLIEAMPESLCIEPQGDPLVGETLCAKPMSVRLLKFYTMLRSVEHTLQEVRARVAKSSSCEAAALELLLKADNQKLHLLRMEFARVAALEYPELATEQFLVVRKGRRIGWKQPSPRMEAVSVSIT